MDIKGKRFENSKLDLEIFVYEIDGKEWFVGKDIAVLLEYPNPSTAVSENVKPKQKLKKYVRNIENIGISGIPNSKEYNNNMTLITEIGLYQLIMKSRKPEAEDFQQWVYEDVLPSIRKNNYYVNEKEIDNEQLNKLQKEIEVLKKQKNMLHEIVYDVSDATFMSFTEASFKLFKKDAKYLKEVLIKEKILGEDGKQVLVKEADFKMNDGTLKKMRLFTEVSIEKPRPEDDIHYNKITNFGYMYLKKYFNSRGMSDFSFNKEVDNND